MEKKSGDGASGKQPADSPSGDDASVKQPADNPSKSEGNNEAVKKEKDLEASTTSSDKHEFEEKKSGDGASKNQPADSPSKSESNDEAEKNEKDTETPTTSSDIRELKTKKEKYTAFSTTEASKEPVALSPTKRKCSQRHVEPEEKQLKADGSKPGSTETGVGMQGSPKKSVAMPETHFTPLQLQQLSNFSSSFSSTNSATRFVIPGSPKRSPMIPGTSVGVVMPGSPLCSPTKPGTSAAGVMRGSPKRSPMMPGTSAGVVMPGSLLRSPTKPGSSAAGVVTQGSPMRSPTKRTYKERQLTFSVDELVEKRLKEESGYQSDSAMDLRKEFKRQMPSSTQSPEHDCQPTSSDKRQELVEKRPEEKHVTQRNFPRDLESASSEVTSSGGGEADVSSTSNESIASSTGEVASSAQGRQVQNLADANKKKTSPSTSPRHSGARPKEASGESRSTESIHVSYPKFSPSRWFYGEPIIRRISPQLAAPSGSADCFKVPPPPPPIEEQDRPTRSSNGLELLNSIIVHAHAIVSSEQAREQMRREKELKARKKKEEAEKLAKAQLQARETRRKLEEKEARLKGGNKSESAENKSHIAAEDTGAGPSTSRDGTTGYGLEGYLEVTTSVDKQATTPGKEEHKIAEPIAERENLSAAQPSMCDENANVMEGGPPLLRACEDDNESKPQPCIVQSNQEGTEEDARPSASGVAAQRPQEVLRDLEHQSLQQLVPQVDEISLSDSPENVADSEQDYNID